mmetsp:Transcript_12842/g.55113  ORF Transcript_12842/g.55113 Transcript_12842/m.55113 type:complete len:265 (+) Transcript_12842:436-1230(+)
MGSVQMALGAGLGATGGAAMSRQNAGERLFSLPAATRCLPVGDTTLATFPSTAPMRLSNCASPPPPPPVLVARTLSTASASLPTHLSNMRVATMVTSWPPGGAEERLTDRVTGTPASTLSGASPRWQMRSLCNNSSFQVVPMMRCAVHLRLDSVTPASVPSPPPPLAPASGSKVTVAVIPPPRISLARSMRRTMAQGSERMASWRWFPCGKALLTIRSRARGSCARTSSNDLSPAFASACTDFLPHLGICRIGNWVSSYARERR